MYTTEGDGNDTGKGEHCGVAGCNNYEVIDQRRWHFWRGDSGVAQVKQSDRSAFPGSDHAVV